MALFAYRAVDSDELWRFESAVVLGGAGAASFLFEDLDGVPTVTGLLDWHGLSIGDPATDLQWLASAPDAADDVYASYVAASGRAPDSHARERARLYAELEFAKWLVHGHDEWIATAVAVVGFIVCWGGVGLLFAGGDRTTGFALFLVGPLAKAIDLAPRGPSPAPRPATK